MKRWCHVFFIFNSQIKGDDETMKMFEMCCDKIEEMGQLKYEILKYAQRLTKRFGNRFKCVVPGISEVNRRSTFTLSEMRDVGSNTENSILPQNGLMSSYKLEQWRQLNGPVMGIPASWREKKRKNREEKDSLFRENRRIGIFYCVAYKHHRQPNQKSMNSTTAVFDWANGYVCIHQQFDFYAAAFLLLCVYYNLTQTLGGHWHWNCHRNQCNQWKMYFDSVNGVCSI